MVFIILILLKNVLVTFTHAQYALQARSSFLNSTIALTVSFFQHFFSAIFVGVCAFFIMSFLGIKYTVLMSFWAFVTNFIPIVGVIFEFVPLALVGLSSGVESMVWLLVLMSVIHGSAFIFFLFVMRGYSKINPFFIILAILIFGQIFNVLGILIAVPLCLIIKLFWTNFIKPYFERG